LCTTGCAATTAGQGAAPLKQSSARRALAGAPPSNATFFCDAASSSCYSLLTPLLSQTAAKARCAQMSGQLASWDHAAKQMEAER
jgi:hypothetical protein